MSEAARARILGRLRRDHGYTGERPRVPQKHFDDRVSRLRSMMEAVHTEFVEADRQSWPSVVRGLGFRSLLAGRNLREHFPEAIVYDRPIEEWKGELFASIDAAVTTTRGAIAETGSLILWPSSDEPRLMSLVPPVHIALVDTSRIHDTFAQVLRDEDWAAGMPPNALLISGPSKTADIEQTLAYGVHGPKRLIVVLI